jgi:H+/Cl- antiporter ClcA
VIGGVGLFLPELLGIGYAPLEGLLAGDERLLRLAPLLLVRKLALLAVSFGSGFLGGMFAPSFFAGAMLGAAGGTLALALAPALDGPGAGAFAVAGMAAFLGALVHAPIAAALIVSALAGDLNALPMLLVAALAGFCVAHRLEPRSVYTFTLPRREPLLSHGE